MFSKPHPNSSFSTESGAGAKTVPGTVACETKTEPGFCSENAFKFLWWKSTYKDSIGSGGRGLCVWFFLYLLGLTAATRSGPENMENRLSPLAEEVSSLELAESP